MGVRVGGLLVLLVVLLGAAGLGRGGAAAAGKGSVLIADLQCDGELTVTRADGTAVAGYVGLQLFAGDRINASVAAVVTLFDEENGTASQDVQPGTPFLVGGTSPAKRQELAAGLKSSIADLFGSADQAHKRDHDVGAVQMGAVIARLPVPAEEPTDNLGASDQPALRRDSTELEKLQAPAAPGARQVAPGAAPSPAPAAAPAPAVAENGATFSDGEAAPSAQAVVKGSSERVPAASNEAPQVPGAGANSAVPPGELGIGGSDGVGARTRLKVSPAMPSAKKERVAEDARSIATPSDQRDIDADVPSALLAKMEELEATTPLARAKLVRIEGVVPALTGAPLSGATYFTSAGASIQTLDQTLIDGRKCRIRAVPQGAPGWQVELVIAPMSEWQAVRARAHALVVSKMPNGGLLAANLLEARGFVLMSYKLRLRAAHHLETGKASSALMRSVWAGVAQQALLLGDWQTAARVMANLRKK